jgi:large subunit ribosomal protein L10
VENPRPEKVAVVDEVREKFSAADAAVLTEYRGLNVAAISQLRRTLRAAGGEYKIYKNTLVRFAAHDLGLELDDLLTGPTAIAFCEGDAAAVAKALRDYARTNPALVVKGGLLGTKALSADDVRALAELPSREVLLAQLAGAMAAPMVQFAGLLQALPRNLAYGLKALIEDRGGVPEAEAAPGAESEAETAVEPEPEGEAAVESEPEAAVEPEAEPQAETPEVTEVTETAEATEIPEVAETPEES